MLTLDPETLASKMWEHTLSLPTDDDNSALGRLWLIGLLHLELDNGGLTQYFRNVGIEDGRKVVPALQRIGAGEHAAVIERAFTVLERDTELLAAINDWCKEIPNYDTLNLIGDEYYALQPPILSVQADFIRKHVDELQPIDG
jgi:hypothetical protein